MAKCCATKWHTLQPPWLSSSQGLPWATCPCHRSVRAREVTEHHSPPGDGKGSSHCPFPLLRFPSISPLKNGATRASDKVQQPAQGPPQRHRGQHLSSLATCHCTHLFAHLRPPRVCVCMELHAHCWRSEVQRGHLTVLPPSHATASLSTKPSLQEDQGASVSDPAPCRFADTKSQAGSKILV